MRLPRVLRLFDVAILSAASMGPAYSLASTMGLMVASVGGLAPVALVLLTAIMLCVAASFAQLSRVLPDAGSSYAWITAAFGRTAGAYAAWILLISNFFATMATAVPAGVYTLDLLAPNVANSPGWAAVVGTLWIVGSAGLLHLGLRPTAMTTAFFVIVEFIVLASSAVVAWLMPVTAPVAPAHLGGGTLGGIAGAMLLAIWMVDGWEVSASASEETQDLGATAGRGGMIGLFVSCAVLLFAMCAYLRVGTIPGFIEHQADAMAYVAQRLGGGPWRVVVVATVLLSTSSALWTTLLYLTRSVYAMGRDNVLPRMLGTLDADGSPTRSLGVVAVLVASVTLLNGFWATAATALGFVVNGSAVFLGLLFLGSSAAAVRLASLSEAGLKGVIVSLCGASALVIVLCAAFIQADPAVRLLDSTLLVAGFAFAYLRRGGMDRTQIGKRGETAGAP